MCLGKALGLVEVKKLISFLVMNYDVGNLPILRLMFTGNCADSQCSSILQIRILDPEAFQVENIWFFKQKGLYAQIQRRRETSL